MSPVPRRDLTPFVVLLVAGAVVLFLLVGGLASVGRSSGPYRRSIDQSFGAEARVLAAQSNSVGSQLRALIARAAGDNRTELSQALDAVVAGADSVSSGTAGISAANEDVSAAFAQAMSDRALAATRLRSTIDGLLALTPGVISETNQHSSPFPPSPVSASAAEKRLAAIGSLLIGSDQSYLKARRGFARSPGGTELPKSVWVPAPVVWDQGALGTTIDQLTSAPDLRPRVDLEILAVSLNPPILPPAPAVGQQPQAPAIAAGASEIPPTCTVSVTVVVRNLGSVVSAKVPVEASVQGVSGGTPFVVKKLVTLAPEASDALSLPTVPVKPGGTYNLTVSLGSPAGQSPAPAAKAGSIAVASFGSAHSNARCARTPAAAP